MKTYTVTDARGCLRELVDQVAHDGSRLLLQRYGKPVAALISAEDAEILEALEDKMDLDAVRAVLKNPKPIPWSQAKKQLGL